MARVVAVRLVSMVAVLLVLILAVFALQRLTPGDPVRAMVGANAPQSVVNAERQVLGMDRPIPVQYVTYLGLLLHGRLGMSLHTRRPVTQDLGDFLPPTLELIGFAFLLALLGGAYLGLSTASRWRGAGVMRFLLITGSSVPVFLFVLLGVLLFFRHLGWLPATGQSSIADAPTGPTRFLLIDAVLAARPDVFFDGLRHLILPGLALAIGPAVAIGRVFRSSLVTTLSSDYVRTARSKGLSERRILLRHAIRNSLGPTLAMAGLQIAILLASDIVVEMIVAWPGLGLYVVQSITANDFPSIAGVTLVLGALYVLVNGIVDILQSVADPRITIV